VLPDINGHTRHGNIFFLLFTGPEKQRGSPVRQIGLVLRDQGMIAENPDPGHLKRKGHLIRQCDFCHQGKQVMIPVRPFARDMKKQIDFGKRGQRLTHPFAST
jgi:hypothetical protein